MKRRILTMAVVMLSILSLNVGRGWAQLTTPMPVFDQLSTQFLQTDQTVMIPVGVSSFGSSSRLKITNVAGLPGVNVEPVTDPVNLSSYAVVNLIWRAPAMPGEYLCQIRAVDEAYGTSTTAVIKVFVSSTTPSNTPAIISPVGTRVVGMNTDVFIPIRASRAFVGPSSTNLSIKASGLPGGVTLLNPTSAKLNASATVAWHTPATSGVYLLNIEASDSSGAFTGVQVPILVGSESAPMPVFDQLSTQFLQTDQTVMIPVGVSSFGSSSRLKITNVAGLPGVNVEPVTDPVNLSSYAVVNLIWRAPAMPGEYLCQIRAVDEAYGTSTTAVIKVFVSSTTPSNTPAIISPVGTRVVGMNTDVFIPIRASRAFVGPSSTNLSIKASGLPGGVTLLNPTSAKLNASATVAWHTPATSGVYLLNIEASDSSGAFTGVQVPIIVP